MDNAVSQDMLMYVADFLVDELSQNAVMAADTKQRMRSYVSNLSAFVAGRMQNGDGDHKITGVKRKDAGTLDVEMQDAKPEKKPRQRNMHNVFVSYGSHCLPSRMMEHREKQLPGVNHMELLNRYSKSLPREKLQVFEEEYKHFLHEYNGEPVRKKGDMKTLALRMQEHDQQKGLEFHPVFDGLIAFIDEEASRVPESPRKVRPSLEAAAAADKSKKPAATDNAAAAATTAKEPTPVAKAPAGKAKSPVGKAKTAKAAKAAPAPKAPAKAAAKAAPKSTAKASAKAKVTPTFSPEAEASEEDGDDDDDEDETSDSSESD